jgi:hypothetical protein
MLMALAMVAEAHCSSAPEDQASASSEAVGDSTSTDTGGGGTPRVSVPRCAGNADAVVSFAYATQALCNADLQTGGHYEGYRISTWTAEACNSPVKYLSAFQGDDFACIQAGNYGWVAVQTHKEIESATDTSFAQGTSGTNYCEAGPFHCLQQAYVTRRNTTDYCNVWDAANSCLKSQVSYTSMYTSPSSVSYANVHFGSGDGCYTQVTQTSATKFYQYSSTACGQESDTAPHTEPEFLPAPTE